MSRRLRAKLSNAIAPTSNATVCLNVDGRMFMAQCQMSLNVPMWREVKEGCASSSLDGGQDITEASGVYPKI